MVRVKAVILMTPDEFREGLPKELQELFDSLVSSLTKDTPLLSEEEAKRLVAGLMLDALKKETVTYCVICPKKS